MLMATACNSSVATCGWPQPWDLPEDANIDNTPQRVYNGPLTLRVMRPSSRQWRFWQPSQVSNGFHQVGCSIGSTNSVWILVSQANKVLKTCNFWWCWIYAFKIPLKVSYQHHKLTSTRRLWNNHVINCNLIPKFVGSGRSDSGSSTLWLLTLFEKSLARLQMSHDGCFGKWLMRCSIDTASALACTVDSGSFGKGTSGALSLSLTSAATDDQSPTSMLGSTAETAGSSAKSGGRHDLYVIRINSSRNSRDHSKLVLGDRNMLGNSWRIKLVRYITCDVTLRRIPDKMRKWARHPNKTKSTLFSIKSTRTNQWTRLKKEIICIAKEARVISQSGVWEEHFSPPLLKTWGFRGNHLRSLTQHRTGNPGHSRPHTRSGGVLRRCLHTTPVYVRIATVEPLNSTPQWCRQQQELWARMLPLILTWHLAQTFPEVGPSCDHIVHFAPWMRPRASDEKCMESWLSQPVSRAFLSPFVFLSVEILLQPSLQRLSAKPELQLQQQQQMVLLARLSEARQLFQFRGNWLLWAFERKFDGSGNHLHVLQSKISCKRPQR